MGSGFVNYPAPPGVYEITNTLDSHWTCTRRQACFLSSKQGFVGVEAKEDEFISSGVGWVWARSGPSDNYYFIDVVTKGSGEETEQENKEEEEEGERGGKAEGNRLREREGCDIYTCLTCALHEHKPPGLFYSCCSDMSQQPTSIQGVTFEWPSQEGRNDFDAGVYVQYIFITSRVFF